MYGFLQVVAERVAYGYHKGERCKHVPGPYINHVKAVADDRQSAYARILAWMHDVAETIIKDKITALSRPSSPDEEELMVRQALQEIRESFRKPISNGILGDRRPHYSVLDYVLADLDALTKRSWQKDDNYVPLYIEQQLLAQADRNLADNEHPDPIALLMVKLADGKNNSDPRRQAARKGPPDYARLRNYVATAVVIFDYMKRQGVHNPYAKKQVTTITEYCRNGGGGLRGRGSYNSATRPQNRDRRPFDRAQLSRQ